MNFTTQCGKNRHTNIANFATLIHKKKLIHCVAIFTILYGNYYSPHGEFELICIGKFARRTWVNFPQQYGKNRQRCQQNKFYYAVWQLLLYYYRNFPSKIISVYYSSYSDLQIDICYWSRCSITSAFSEKRNYIFNTVEIFLWGTGTRSELKK